MKNQTLLGAGLILYLAGCTLEPHYHRPPPGVTVQWPAMPSADSPASEPDPSQRSAAQIGWREFFTDPKLQTLIEQALWRTRTRSFCSVGGMDRDEDRRGGSGEQAQRQGGAP